MNLDFVVIFFVAIAVALALVAIVIVAGRLLR